MVARASAMVVAALLGLCACSSSVSVAPPEPAVDADTCADFMAALPDTLMDKASRPTDPASDLTAAWGDPAITVRCGVPDPAALTPTSQLITIDGVDWFPEQTDGGYRFTTYDRVTNVEVDVPDDYSPEADAATLLSPLVKDAVPAADSRH